MSLEDFAGFGIRGYRSFGSEDISFFGPLAKVHLIVGRNDVGKSNALSFFRTSMQALRKQNGSPSSSQIYPLRLDRPDDWDVSQARIISICLKLTDNVRNILHYDDPNVRSWLSSEAYAHGNDNIVWLDLEVGRSNGHLLIFY